jgi:hypothetical protein
MAVKTLASIISEIEKQKTKVGQIKAILDNDSEALRTVFEFTFDPMLQWLVPDTDPPYRPLTEAIDQEGNFYREIKKLVYFTNTPEGLNTRQVKREQLYIQVLESIDAEDAKLLLRMRRKEIKVMVWAIKEAYPKMTGHWK